MDHAELIMGVEEAFDFEIPDHEAARMRTAGQLYAYVVSRLAGAPSRRCPSSALFYRTRRSLMELSGVPRRSISPSTLMEGALPRDRRKTDWQNLRRAIEAPLPDLELPRWMSQLESRLRVAILFACLAAYFICPITLAIRCSLAGALLFWAVSRLTAPFAVQIPAACATVGGTVRAVLDSGNPTRLQTSGKWDPNEVWQTLCKVIAEQFDVPPESITPDTDFVYDLGAD
jgi:acyl carrier protein